MKKKTSFLLALALGLAAAPMLAAAQDFKAPIRLIVPYGAGGSTDAMARAVGPTLSKELGQPVLIENKPGANGQIGTQFVKTAPGDGTVFLFTLDHSVVIVPFVTPGVTTGTITSGTARLFFSPTTSRPSHPSSPATSRDTHRPDTRPRTSAPRRPP